VLTTAEPFLERDSGRCIERDAIITGGIGETILDLWRAESEAVGVRDQELVVSATHEAFAD
jgi:hypothetical protein